jgi:hypothetical protein
VNPYTKLGAILIFFALLFYTIGILKEQMKKTTSWFVLIFLGLGVLFDVAATGLMMAGAQGKVFTAHGVIGYSALITMVIDTILIWRFHFKNPANTPVTKGLHLYTRACYAWWMVAFLTGTAMAMSRRMG